MAKGGEEATLIRPEPLPHPTDSVIKEDKKSVRQSSEALDEGPESLALCATWRTREGDDVADISHTRDEEQQTLEA